MKELLCQLTGFLKPMMDRAVEDPLYRMHNGRSTFTLEINWAYSKDSKKIEKSAISEKRKMAADFPAKTPSERRHLVRNRLRRERKKAARALRRTTTAKSPITVSPDVTPPAKTPPSTSTPMDEETSGSLPPGDVEEPPPPELAVRWDQSSHNTFDIADFRGTDLPAIMYRATKKGYPERVFVAKPMSLLRTDREITPAYAVCSWINYHSQENYHFIASANQVALIDRLKETGTAVSLATATTYKMVDDVNARLYARAIEVRGDAIESLSDVADIIHCKLADRRDDPSSHIAMR